MTPERIAELREMAPTGDPAYASAAATWNGMLNEIEELQAAVRRLEQCFDEDCTTGLRADVLRSLEQRDYYMDLAREILADLVHVAPHLGVLARKWGTFKTIKEYEQRLVSGP